MNDENIIPVDLIEAQVKKHEKADIGEELYYGAVVYTDGGGLLGNPHQNIPNTAGYGIHGYLYVNTPTKTGAGVTGYTLSNYGYIANNQLSHPLTGYNIYKPEMGELRFTPYHAQPVVYFEGLGGLCDATNNVGEATAFLKALDVIERAAKEVPLKYAHFRIDSKYVINGILSRFDYIANNWVNKTGKVVANKDLWVEISARLEELSSLGLEVTVEWVKGHSDFFGNIQADKLATAGLVAASNQHYFEHLKIMPAQGKWSSGNAVDFKEHPEYYFMVDANWYYDPQYPITENEMGLKTLCFGNHDKQENIGQPKGDTFLSVAMVKEIPKTMERMISIARKLDRIDSGLETHGMFYAQSNVLLKPDFAEQLNTFDECLLHVNSTKKMIKTYDKKEVLSRVHPPYISFKQMEKFSELNTLLHRVIKGELQPHEHLNDVTDVFYEKTVNKKGKVSFKVKIDNEPFLKQNVVVNVNDANNVYCELSSNVTLTYGITAPRRRVISGLKDFDPKIYILTSLFERQVGFRYYFIIELPTGEYSIWTNAEANLRLF